MSQNMSTTHHEHHKADTNAQTCLHLHTSARIQTEVLACKHCSVCVCVHACACVCTCTHALAGACTHAHSCTHACTRTQAHTHISMHARSAQSWSNTWPGDMLFYRLACVHMCVWHRTTGIALYFGPKYRQSPTEPNFRINFLPGSIVHGTLHAFQIRCQNFSGKGKFWQI